MHQNMPAGIRHFKNFSGGKSPDPSIGQAKGERKEIGRKASTEGGGNGEGRKGITPDWGGLAPLCLGGIDAPDWNTGHGSKCRTA